MDYNKKLINQVYGGWLGKVIGVIHGANTEGWTYEKIKSTFGVITEYPFRFKNFCADDDINGPIFFQRVFLDYDDISIKSMTKTFLNYVSDGHGFFWWGGYGVSTEHTAYQNLIDGIDAPLSGSAKQNGRIMANQIGGQIFSDCFGILNPGDPKKAAEYAATMASITHDEEGLNGARFIAACIAKAYVAESIEEIVKTALEQLDQASEYAKMVVDVWEYCKEHRDDWEVGFAYVKSKYDYAYYGGVCHIIPNAAVIVLSLLYGEGDYSKTINIANMCGWDTDCNVGNLGAILGVYVGINGIEEKWISQVNDFICASSSLGYLNIQTVSQVATSSLKIMQRMGIIKLNETWKQIVQKTEGQYFHFEFPTATHGFRVKSVDNVVVRLENVDECSHIGKRSLRITAPVIENSQSFVLYYKSYYRPEDFNDNRYSPDFSPTIYPGDKISFYYRFDKSLIGKKVKFVPHILGYQGRDKVKLSGMELDILDTEWKQYSFTIPEEGNYIVEEVGVEVVAQNIAPRETSTVCRFYLDEFEIESHANYRVDCGLLPLEKFTAIDVCPAQFSYLRGIVELSEGCLQISGSGKCCEAYTGSTNWDNYYVKATIIPKIGEEHYVLVRVQGGQRNYAIGFTKGNKLAILKKDGSYTELINISYRYELGMEYVLEVLLEGAKIKVIVNGKELIMYTDLSNPYLHGCIGFGNQRASRTAVANYQIKELG